MENNAVITINNLVKRFPVGGDFFHRSQGFRPDPKQR